MSIIDELLVLLDDQEEITLKQIKEKLPKRSKQTLSSTLGRLSARGWISSTKNKGEKYYKITPDGRGEITSHLIRIKEMQNRKWDGTWLIIVFNIPEKLRKGRDLFRRNLIELGFAKIREELWISFWDKRSIVEDLIKDLQIESYCTVFKIGKLDSEDQKNILSTLSWNEDELNQQYKNFITSAVKFLKSTKDGFQARLLVFTYTKILQRDPKFPSDTEPKNYQGRKSFEIYLKLRPYCYK